jgi:hypothetical protein
MSSKLKMKMVDFMKTTNEFGRDGRIDTSSIRNFDTKYMLTEFTSSKRDNANTNKLDFMGFDTDDNNRSFKKGSVFKKSLANLLNSKEDHNNSSINNISFRTRMTDIPQNRNTGGGGSYFNYGK